MDFTALVFLRLSPGPAARELSDAELVGRAVHQAVADCNAGTVTGAGREDFRGRVGVPVYRIEASGPDGDFLRAVVREELRHPRLPPGSFVLLRRGGPGGPEDQTPLARRSRRRGSTRTRGPFTGGF